MFKSKTVPWDAIPDRGSNGTKMEEAASGSQP